MSVRSLNVQGLNYETELTALYLGDFKSARLKPNGAAVSMVFREYLEAYGRHCNAYLPANKVPITISKCATENVTKDGFGNEVSRYCIKWVEVPTGLYAAPMLYNASNRLSKQAGVNLMAKSLRGDVYAGRSAVDDKLSLGNDMDVFVRQNNCGGAALERFEQNLYRFVEGKSPLRLAGNQTLASERGKNKANFNAKNLNLKKLLDDLISENSKGWMLNRYVRGSVSNIEIQDRNGNGSPKTVHANYGFNTLGQISSGYVLLTFSKDIPKCMFFSDAPQTCRHPSRRIINDYEKGRYLN